MNLDATGDELSEYISGILGIDNQDSEKLVEKVETFYNKYYKPENTHLLRQITDEITLNNKIEGIEQKSMHLYINKNEKTIDIMYEKYALLNNINDVKLFPLQLKSPSTILNLTRISFKFLLYNLTTPRTSTTNPY